MTSSRKWKPKRGSGERSRTSGRAAVAKGEGGELAVEAVAQLAGGGRGQRHVLLAADQQAAAGHAATDHGLQDEQAGEHAGAGVHHVERPRVPGADGGADAHRAGGLQVKFIFPVVLGNAGADDDIQLLGAVAGHGQRPPRRLDAQVERVLAHRHPALVDAGDAFQVPARAAAAGSQQLLHGQDFFGEIDAKALDADIAGRRAAAPVAVASFMVRLPARPGRRSPGGRSAPAGSRVRFAPCGCRSGNRRRPGGRRSG